MYNTGAKATTSRDVRKGSWTDEEDNLLRKCIEKFGEGNWHRVPLRAGLNRCRKSCRLRWMNYLKPNIKRGQFNVDEVDLIIRLHKLLGNRWSLIAGRIPGRTANDVKNYWNTHLHKKSSPLPPKHPNTMNNNISIKNNVKESHKKQATLPTTTSKSTIPMHPKIIRPKPSWTFPRAPYLETRKPAPLIMGRPNRPINGPRDESVSRNSLDKEHEEKEEAEDDDAKAKWWENLVEMYEKEENEELNGSKDGLGFQEPNNPRVLKMWPMSCSEVLPSSSNPVEERNIWEDDDLWNFDVNVWE